MSVISSFVAGIDVLWLSSFSLIFKNTESKYLLNIQANETTRAECVLSEAIETCDGIRLDLQLVDVLKNDQNSVGLPGWGIT